MKKQRPFWPILHEVGQDDFEIPEETELSEWDFPFEEKNEQEEITVKIPYRYPSKDFFGN